MRTLLRLSPVFAGIALVGAPVMAPRMLAHGALAQVAPAQVAPLAASADTETETAARDARTWTTYKGDAQRTGSSMADVKLPLSLRWRFSSDAPSRTYQTSPLVVGAPGRQRVIFAAGRNVYGLDMATGAQIWKSPDLTSNVITPITLLSDEGGDLILTGQQGGRLAALRVSDGARVWEVDALSQITNAGPILVNTSKGQRIVVAVSAGQLLAYDFAGVLDADWKAPIGQFAISPTTSMSLSKDGTLIFIGGSDSKLYAIDARKGGSAFAITLAGNTLVTPVVAGNQLITTSARAVAAYKSQNGASLWKFDPQGEVIGSPSVGTDATGKNVVYFGTREGNFYALDDTGAQKWKIDAGVGFTGSPLVLPTVVICGTFNGLLVGMEPATGAIIWQYRLKTDRPLEITASSGRGGTTGAGGRGGGGRGAGGRGGRGGGFAGRGSGRGAVSRTGPIRTWGVSSAPTATDGQLLVFGDNAALYSFTTGSFDADPPRVIEPSLALPDEQNKITPLLLGNGNLQIPGRGPIYFAAQLDDTGSGVDPKSIKATLDNVALAADAINFDASTGVVTLTLLDPAKGGTGLPDGLKSLSMTALDYAGNPLRYSVGFLVDNTVTAPKAQPDVPVDTGDGGFPGGTGDSGDGTGGFPGSGFPGGGAGFPGGMGGG